MDYPKSVPNVGLVDGQFADENPATGQVGSLIPSAWGNAVTQELLNVIKAAGFVPAEGQTNQLLKAIQGLVSQGIKNSVRVATTGAIALSGVQTIDAIVLVAGDRVLVKNQASGAQNGIYVVAAGAWVRALDADESVEVKPGMLVGVDAGTVNGGSVWRLSNTIPPILGASALTFEQVFGKTGVVAGSYKSVTVGADGRVTGGTNPTTLAGFGILDAFTKTESSAAIQAAIAALVASSPAALDTLNELATAIGNDPNFATTMLNALAGKADKGTTLAAYGILDAYTKTYLDSAFSFRAPLNNPTFTGTAHAPTPAAGSNSTEIATAAFVQAAMSAIQGSAKNLAGSASGLSAASSYTADEIVVESATNACQVLRAVNIAPSFANAGVNGLDVGAGNSQAASTWYSVWVIWNGVTISGLLSLSASAPTLPAGYTHKARLGWVRTDATANKFPLAFNQVGRRVQYTALRDMASGVMAAWTSIAVGAFVPPTAGVITGRIQNANAACAVAPNANYDNYGVSHVYLPSGNGTAAHQFDVVLESSNIYGYSTASGSKFSVLGWEDVL